MKGGLGGAESVVIETQLVGRYNVSNILCVLATLSHLGYELGEAAKVCAKLPPVAGRMQRINDNSSTDPIVIVDYAHTPDALEKALASLKPLTQLGGQLHCLIGCGGDRDSGKRPHMAQAAHANADKVIFTADNPRTEKAQSIIDEMLAGIAQLDNAKVSVEIDRAKAIGRLIHEARAGDIILLAGKGHEDYQDVNGVKIPFSDVQQAEIALAARALLRSRSL